MVWAGISAKGRPELIFFDKKERLAAKIYQERVLEPVIQWIDGRDITLQQDWAPAHGAKSTFEFAKGKLKILGKDLWPAHSPDLTHLISAFVNVGEQSLRYKTQVFGIVEARTYQGMGRNFRQRDCVHH